MSEDCERIANCGTGRFFACKKALQSFIIKYDIKVLRGRYEKSF